MERFRETIDCGMTSYAEDGPVVDAASSVPALLGQIAQLQEESASLRTMVCELLRKNERLREQAATVALLEMPVHAASSRTWA